MRPAVLSVLATFLLLPEIVFAQANPPTTRLPFESDPKFTAALTKARDLFKQREYGFALDAFEKANKISGNQCRACLTSVYEIDLGSGRYKEARAAAQRLVDLAPDPAERSIAEGKVGRVLFRSTEGKPKTAELEAAHAAFEAALADYPRNLSARWDDACVLARLGKLDQSAHQFNTCATSASPADPMRTRARHFAENPSLSLEKMAPAFEVTALDGSRFNLDNMGGRVVLIDFWATWCGPCNEELPHLRKIAREFAGDPLVIISISWDRDETRWKEFVARNDMAWLQYRDADHKLSDLFAVNAIPHYFTIDSDGVLTAEMMGSGSNVEGKLKKLLKRAREEKPAAPHATELQTGN